MKFYIGDKVSWYDHDDEPERTGEIYEVDHDLDYYFAVDDLPNSSGIIMSHGSPGRNFKLVSRSADNPAPTNDNVVCLDDWR